MTPWGKKHLALAALVAATCSQAKAIEPRYLVNPGLAQTALPSTTPSVAGDVLAVGGLLAHLDSFVEQGDGTVRAEISFRNPSGAAASFAPPRMSETVVELVNGEGRKYRLISLSAFGDTQTRSDWISVPASGTAVVTAIFAPDGARRGAQPFALSFPVRETWQAAMDAAERTSTFAVNFRGLHRPTDEAQAAPAPHVERVSLPAAPPTTRVPEPVPAISGNFNDDLTPAIAKLTAVRPDNRRYLVAIGVNAYDEAPAVPFADRSAKAMSDLLRKAYSVPEENITLLTGADATGTKMTGRINSLIQRLTPGDTVFFYYAGHGFSARDGHAVYIVPKDAVPGAYEVEALSLASLLARFEASPASRVVAFLDTCFSGRISRDQSLFPGTAPLMPVPVQAASVKPSGKVTLFLAGQGNQFANDYPERGHRLFSYYVMQGLLAGYGSASDLEAFVAREVRRVSTKRGSDFVQEPQLEGTALALPSRAVKSRTAQAN